MGENGVWNEKQNDFRRSKENNFRRKIKDMRTMSYEKVDTLLMNFAINWWDLFDERKLDLQGDTEVIGQWTPHFWPVNRGLTLSSQ